MPKRILYLSDYELRAFQTKGKTLTEVLRLKTNSKIESEFVNYLTKNIKIPIYWLIDTTQEEYQVSLLPHVLGKDRRDLLAYKMKRLFEKTPYGYGVVQEREKQGRGDDRVLFTALNNPALLQPWLNLITTHKVPLAGIYSLPLLSQNLLKYLPKKPYFLLVTNTPPISSHSSAGLRQSFFVNQKLQFSRLIPLNSLEPQEHAEYVVSQIVKTHNYLDNAGRLPPIEAADSSLSVAILTDTRFLKPLKKSIHYDSSVMNIQVLDNRDFARQLGWQTDEPKLYLHNFVAYQLSRRWHIPNHYAQATDGRYFFYRQVRIALYFASVLLLSGAAAASSMILEQTLLLKQKGQKTIKEITNRETQLKQLREQEPRDLPLRIELIRNVVDVGRYIKAHHISPQPAWEKLSQVLHRHPLLFLERLEWGIGHSKPEIFSPAPDLVSRNYDKTTETSDNPSEQLDPAKNFLEGLRLHGQIYPFQGNYQNALQAVRQFVEDLRQETGWTVEERDLPDKSGRALEGSIGSETEVGKAPFVLDLFIKHDVKKPS